MTLFQSAHGLAPVDCQVFETHEPSRLIASLPCWQQLARDDVLVVGVAGDLLRRAEAALVDVLQHLQRVGEGLGSGDPLAAARVVQSVFARSVEQHLEALHRAGLAAGLAGEDVDRRDTGDLGLDRLGRVHDVGPGLRLPVGRQTRLGEDLFVVPEAAGVGAHRDAVDLAVVALAGVLRVVEELRPVGPLLHVGVEGLEVAGLGIRADEERVFVEHVGGGGRAAVHQRELRVVVVLGGFDGNQGDLLARVGRFEALLRLVHEDAHEVGSEVLIGDLDGLPVVGTGRRASGQSDEGGRGHDGGQYPAAFHRCSFASMSGGRSRPRCRTLVVFYKSI